VKFEYQSNEERRARISEIASLCLATGRPARDFYRMRTRLSGFAYLAFLLSMFIGMAISARFERYGRWRGAGIAFATSALLNFVYGRFFPLHHSRIDVKAPSD